MKLSGPFFDVIINSYVNYSLLFSTAKVAAKDNSIAEFDKARRGRVPRAHVRAWLEIKYILRCQNPNPTSTTQQRAWKFGRPKMVKCLLMITAELENLTNLEPQGGCDDPNFSYFFKVSFSFFFKYIVFFFFFFLVQIIFL